MTNASAGFVSTEDAIDLTRLRCQCPHRVSVKFGKCLVKLMFCNSIGDTLGDGCAASCMHPRAPSSASRIVRKPAPTPLRPPGPAASDAFRRPVCPRRLWRIGRAIHIGAL